MEFRTLFINILLISLVTIGIFYFAIGTQDNYSVTDPIKNNNKLSFYNDIKGNLTTYENDSNNSQTGFFSSPPSVDSGGLMLVTIVSSAQILVKTISGIFNLLVNGVASILGIPPFVVIILNTMIIGVVILLIWSLIRLGR